MPFLKIDEAHGQPGRPPCTLPDAMLGGYWEALTRMPLKAELYARDPYFREALADTRALLQDGTDAALRHGALLVVKPDGMVSGKARLIVEFLRSHQFAILAVEVLELTRFHWRELWRYQLGAASIDRLAVYDLILQGKALLLVLRHDGPLDVPATVRLSALKGTPDPELQSPTSLRGILGQPNRLFSYFHVADEPADLLRELAVLLDTPARRRVLSTLTGARLSSAERSLLDETIAASERTARVLDARAALDRVERLLRGMSGSAAEHVRADLETMRRGGRIAWRPFRLRNRCHRRRDRSMGPGNAGSELHCLRRARHLEVDQECRRRLVAVSSPASRCAV